MKIALISPLSYPVPPKKYGGTQSVVHYLAESLVRAGHEVTLFAPDGSSTAGKLDKTFGQSIVGSQLDPKNIDYCKERLRYIASLSARFDIIHNHDALLPLAFEKDFKAPMVSTWHSVFEPDKIEESWLSLLLKTRLISISNAQRKNLPGGNFVATVYNGTTDLTEYTFGEGGDYLVWLGRFNETKGPLDAIRIAKKTGHKLLIAGAIISDIQKAYFKDKIEPLLSDQIIYVGEVDLAAKIPLLGGAKAMLMPVKCDESFGLVMTEAMACGTPVIAYERGAVPEVIRSGYSGFVVPADDIEAAADAVGFIDRINRQNCRQWVATNFLPEKMVSGYLDLYGKIVAREI